LTYDCIAALSNGELVANPHHLEQAQARATDNRRSLSREKRGGRNRGKARARVCNAWCDLQHQLARELVNRFVRITVEYLHLSGRVRSNLACSTSWAAWGGFRSILSARAEQAGRVVVAVDPHVTSQRCSGCDVLAPKELSARVHR